MSLSILIPQFEGPLGLLLYLIKKEEMDIFDIDVQLITSQYLEYIKKMKQFDLEVAGDFIAMAATLIQIKSKMLLPNYNEDGEEEELEDPRKELVKRLLEYQQFQEVSKKMYDRPLLGRDVFKRGGKNASFHSDEEGEIILDEGGLFALIALYRGSIRKMKKAVHRVANKTRSIAGRILEIKDRLIVGQRVVLRELIQSVDEFRAELLITFLSALELGKMGAVSVYQSEIYGDIYLRALKPIDGTIVSNVEEYDSINAEAIADSLMVDAIEEQEEGDDDLPLMQAAEDTEAEPEDFEVATDEEIDAAEMELNIEMVNADLNLDPTLQENLIFKSEESEVLLHSRTETDRDESLISALESQDEVNEGEEFEVSPALNADSLNDFNNETLITEDILNEVSSDETELNMEQVDEEPKLDGEPT